MTKITSDIPGRIKVDQERMRCTPREEVLKQREREGCWAHLARRISEYTVKEIADHFRWSSFAISKAIR